MSKVVRQVHGKTGRFTGTVAGVILQGAFLTPQAIPVPLKSLRLFVCGIKFSLGCQNLALWRYLLKRGKLLGFIIFT